MKAAFLKLHDDGYLDGFLKRIIVSDGGTLFVLLFAVVLCNMLITQGLVISKCTKPSSGCRVGAKSWRKLEFPMNGICISRILAIIFAIHMLVT